MRILLDNCVPLRLRKLLPGHEVTHTSQVGWENIRNGALLSAAAGRFDVIITTDQNIRYQQNLAKLPIAVIELDSRDTRFTALRTFEPYLARALEATRASLFVVVTIDGRVESLSARPGVAPPPPQAPRHENAGGNDRDGG